MNGFWNGTKQTWCGTTIAMHSCTFHVPYDAITLQCIRYIMTVLTHTALSMLRACWYVQLRLQQQLKDEERRHRHVTAQLQRFQLANPALNVASIRDITAGGTGAEPDELVRAHAASNSRHRL